MCICCTSRASAGFGDGQKWRWAWAFGWAVFLMPSAARLGSFIMFVLLPILIPPLCCFMLLSHFLSPFIHRSSVGPLKSSHTYGVNVEHNADPQYQQLCSYMIDWVQEKNDLCQLPTFKLFPSVLNWCTFRNTQTLGSTVLNMSGTWWFLELNRRNNW